MKAFVKTGHAPREGGIKEIPTRAPSYGEARVKVDSCGVCGSDLHAYASDPGFEWVKIPVTLGHEFSGTVEEVGESVSGIEGGDRVVAIAIQGCGECDLCRAGSTQLCADRVSLGLDLDGGMAEYAVMPARHLVTVPPELDLGIAALCEPLAVAVHAVNARSDVKPGGTVVVSGPGPIGLLCALVARLAGARVLVTGLGADSKRRLPVARLAGLRTADLGEASLEEHLLKELGTAQPDLWIESSGSVRALGSALDSVRPGGNVTVVGLYPEDLTFFPTVAVRREIGVNFSYTCNHPDYRTALELLASGSVDPGPLISTYPLERAPEAFEAVRGSQAIKAVLSAAEAW